MRQAKLLRQASVGLLPLAPPLPVSSPAVRISACYQHELWFLIIARPGKNRNPAALGRVCCLMATPVYALALPPAILQPAVDFAVQGLEEGLISPVAGRLLF